MFELSRKFSWRAYTERENETMPTVRSSVTRTPEKESHHWRRSATRKSARTDGVSFAGRAARCGFTGARGVSSTDGIFESMWFCVEKVRVQADHRQSQSA